MEEGSMGAFVASLSWPEVERRITSGAVAVLPVGAACKEHGPHLPMQTDLLQAEWLATALARRANLLVWPTVSYGYYPAFSDYPGSVSLTRETFERLVGEILECVERAGARALLIVNTGISTIAPLRATLGAATQSFRIELANVYDGPNYRRVATSIEEQRRGGHADELETSILLEIAPQHVALDKAQAWVPTATEASGPFSRFDPNDPRFSPAGVWGDPTLASADKGRRLLEAMLEDLLTALEGLPQIGPNG